MNSEASAAGANDRPSGSPTNDDSGPDWTDQVADLVVDTVDKIRAKTTGPIQNVLQAVAYAVVALIVAVPLSIVLFAGTIRFLDWAIPGDVWITYAILAAVLLLAGVILWSRRKPVP